MSEIELFEPELPEDFISFWKRFAEEALSVPLWYRRSLTNDFDLSGFRIESLVFHGMAEVELHGWIAYPESAKRLPSFLWIPPYGRESLLPNEFGTREGMTSMSFNFHGHGAFHQENYRTERGYFSEEVESPDTWIFKTMIQNAIIAARVLQAQPEVDEDRISVAGMSQGGGMAIWLAALVPFIKSVAADMPFLGGLSHVLARQAYRYPLKELTDYADLIPLGMERILNTISYFDSINFATLCKVPTLISAGTKDPAVRVDQAKSIFEALPGEKEFVLYEWGHDWHPEMVERNRTWMLEHMK
jgi:cephalosporin-C deacetylase